MRKVGFAVMLAIVFGAPLGFWGLRAEEGTEDMKTSDKQCELPFEKMRVAILTGEGFQDAEALMPLAYLTNRGAKVTVIGVEPGKVKAYNSDIELYIHKSVTDVAPADFDALIMPGGKAPAKIREHEAVVTFVREFYQLGRPMAAICHGPQVLVRAGVVEGKNMTCYSGVADELRAADAHYKDVPVVRDGHLITSRVPKDIPVWLATLEEALREAAEKAE